MSSTMSHSNIMLETLSIKSYMIYYRNLWKGILLEKVRSNIGNISESLPQNFIFEGKTSPSKWVLLQKDRVQVTLQIHLDN